MVGASAWNCCRATDAVEAWATGDDEPQDRHQHQARVIQEEHNATFMLSEQAINKYWEEKPYCVSNIGLSDLESYQSEALRSASTTKQDEFTTPSPILTFKRRFSGSSISLLSSEAKRSLRFRHQHSLVFDEAPPSPVLTLGSRRHSFPSTTSLSLDTDEEEEEDAAVFLNPCFPKSNSVVTSCFGTQGSSMPHHHGGGTSAILPPEAEDEASAIWLEDPDIPREICSNLYNNDGDDVEYCNSSRIRRSSLFWHRLRARRRPKSLKTPSKQFVSRLHAMS